MSRFLFRCIQALSRRKSKKSKPKTNSEFRFPQTTERDYHCLSPYDLSLVLSEGYEIFCEEKKLQYLQNHRRYCIENTALCRNDTSAPASFTLFPLLPAELRIQIWSEVASFPQFVELCCIPEHPNDRWFSHNEPPAMLDCGWEARAVLNKYFSKLEFSLAKSLPHDDNVQLPPLDPIYFNFSTSTLWLSADVEAFYARKLLENNLQLRTQLRRLVVDERVWIALNGGREAIAWEEREFMPKRERSGAMGRNLKALEDVQFHGSVDEALNSEGLP